MRGSVSVWALPLTHPATPRPPALTTSITFPGHLGFVPALVEIASLITSSRCGVRSPSQSRLNSRVPCHSPRTGSCRVVFVSRYPSGDHFGFSFSPQASFSTAAVKDSRIASARLSIGCSTDVERFHVVLIHTRGLFDASGRVERPEERVHK
jgi:hypothetical protein